MPKKACFFNIFIMADITKIQNLEFLHIGTPDIPEITLSEPSNKGSTVLEFNSPITLKDDSSPITKAIHLAIQAVDTNQILVFYVPAGGFTTTQKAEGVVRGIVRGGLDLTETAYDIDLPTGSRVIGVISQFHINQLVAFALGIIASGGNKLIIGDGTDVGNKEFYYFAAAGYKAFLRYNITTGKVEFSDNSVDWSNLSTVGAHGNSADFKDHIDVASAVSDSPVEGDALIYKNGIWDKNVDSITELIAGEAIAVNKPIFIGYGGATQILQESGAAEQVVQGIVWSAQSFILNSPPYDKLFEIELFLRRENNPGTLHVEVYLADGLGKPTGSLLTSLTYSGNNLPTTASWVNLGRFSPIIALNPANSYVFVVYIDNSSPNQVYVGYAATTNPYADGIRLGSTDGGSSWATFGADDLKFRIKAVEVSTAKTYISDKDVLGKERVDGFSIETAAAENDPLLCKMNGLIDGFSGLELGREYFLGNGAIKVDDGDIGQSVGFAIKTDILNFKIP